jgi:hypothetical protein
MTEQTNPQVSDYQVEDFTMFLAFATQGILASIPFGVNVDPVHVATAAKNTALAMLQAKAEAIAD